MGEVIFKGVQFPKTCADCFFWPICPCMADYKDYSEILDAVADGNLVRADGCTISPAKNGRADNG
ncbi:MAG: hypothetical protein IKO68_08345 [Oscillospiraceae bacterium]|nr:hypothetical protein [Oscillospiraceae bacterium]